MACACESLLDDLAFKFETIVELVNTVIESLGGVGSYVEQIIDDTEELIEMLVKALTTSGILE